MVALIMPKPVSDAMLAFPAEVQDLLPEIPDGWDDSRESETWVLFQSDWFSDGLREGLQAHMTLGVDGNEAFRHLACIQGTFSIKHEVKVSAVAYLSSLWFSRLTDEDGALIYGS